MIETHRTSHYLILEATGNYKLTDVSDTLENEFLADTRDDPLTLILDIRNSTANPDAALFWNTLTKAWLSDHIEHALWRATKGQELCIAAVVG